LVRGSCGHPVRAPRDQLASFSATLFGSGARSMPEPDDTATLAGPWQ
jgi:hypothetical protein